MSDIALPRIKAKRRKLKPPPPSFWWALFQVVFDVGLTMLYVGLLVGNLNDGDGVWIVVDVAFIAMNLKFLLRGFVGRIVIKGIPIAGPSDWSKFRRELERWLEDDA